MNYILKHLKCSFEYLISVFRLTDTNQAYIDFLFPAFQNANFLFSFCSFFLILSSVYLRHCAFTKAYFPLCCFQCHVPICNFFSNFFKSNLYTPHGAQTQDSKIHSHVLYGQSQSGTSPPFFFSFHFSLSPTIFMSQNEEELVFMFLSYVPLNISV